MLLTRSSFRFKKGSKAFRRLRTSPIRFAALVILGVALLLFTQNRFRDWVNNLVYDLSVGLIALIERPIADFDSFKKNIQAHLYIQKNAQSLETILLQLRTHKNHIQNLERENEELKELISLKEGHEPLVTVPCFGQYAKLNSKSIFIKAGHDTGIQRYDAVMAQDTIVGQVDEVGGRTARVLLVTDSQSRVPVYCEQSGQEGILKGTPTGQLKLTFVHRPENIVAGEKVFSSGIDGSFPRGKFMGTVTKVQGEAAWIEPAFDQTALRYVGVYKSHHPSPAPGH
jgi:rod shape-determining protein MreC